MLNIPSHVSSWPNRGLEHQVERHRRSEVISCRGGFHIVIHKEIRELLLAVVVQLWAKHKNTARQHKLSKAVCPCPVHHKIPVPCSGKKLLTASWEERHGAGCHQNTDDIFFQLITPSGFMELLKALVYQGSKYQTFCNLPQRRSSTVVSTSGGWQKALQTLQGGPMVHSARGLSGMDLNRSPTLVCPSQPQQQLG